jgi:TolA-binding protein
MILGEFSVPQVSLRAHSLLAWTYAQQGELDLAIAEQEKLLRRTSSEDDVAQVSNAVLNRAHVLFNRKDYKNAAAAYEDFLGRYPAHPKRPVVLYQVGQVYLRLDRSGDAVDRWEALLAAAPGVAMAEKAWMRSGDVYFRAGRFEDAKRCFMGLLENFDSSDQRAAAMLRLAQCEYNAGADAAALQAYSQVIAAFPATPEAVEAESGVQQSLYRLGGAADGVDVLSELVERFPTSPFAADAQLRVARLHHEQGRYVEAADAFRRVVSQFPTFSAANEAHFLMADAYEKSGNVEAAQRAYEQFTMFFPEDNLRSTAAFRLATLQFAAEEYGRASIGFLQVYEADIGDDLTRASLFTLALCRKQMGDVVQGEQFLEDYLRRYATDERAPEVAFHLGDLQERAGRTDQAVAQYERALKTHPKRELEPQLHFRLGICQEALGDDKAALTHFKAAQAHPVRSDPFRLSAVVRLAAMYEDKTQYKSALSAYKDLIRNAGDAELVAVATERVAQLTQALQ